ncbi:hypothetical protein K7640_20370 [Micromonospora sp. PLK6-60]|uniref:hypothetical protein n=1 Tax=Micromonospora sp. PLK6-60 TaxID=2873383 RepID=UPI001CA5FE79|nr:hypothetical protein [Micromonospora sp. PLK6-60]MBY8874187.1 hypothetical protein [Micromonospora sp. PLK6-60]
MDDALTDAIQRGDLAAVRDHLAALPREARWRGEGSAVAGALIRFGGPGLAHLFYRDGEILPDGPWGDVDPVRWAAEHGASDLLSSLLLRASVPEATRRTALDAARAWLDVDPEAELRRRSGFTDADHVTVRREHLTTDEYEPRVLRIRLTTADGRWTEVLVAHRAAVTVLEESLDLSVSPDELLARARWSADPESYDWSAARHALMTRFPPAEVFRWAAERLADPDVLVRRFTAELLHFGTVDGETPDAPYAGEACAVLRERMAAEPDTETLCAVLGAYAGYRETGAILFEFLPFATDERAQVRARVAHDLLNGHGGAADDPPPEILAAMTRLARDPDPDVRAVATATLGYSPIDVPALRELFAAQLAGDDHEVEILAATGLALRHDAAALARLGELSEADGYESRAWWAFDSVQRMLARPDRR